jgi:hypothetical protein
VNYRKKLIEVAPPLEAINAEAGLALATAAAIADDRGQGVGAGLRLPCRRRRRGRTSGDFEADTLVTGSSLAIS